MSLSHLLSHRGGAGAAEFALVLPLLLLFIFGIIDGGRFLWEMNRMEKAAQAGVRAAVVTDIIPGGFVGYNYVGVSGLTQGDRIPASALGSMVCTLADGCDCTAGTCPPEGDFNTASWTRIVDRMKELYPELTDANVQIEYSGSGLGFAGDPNGMDIVPIVTVRITGMQFKPITSFHLLSLGLPDVRSSLTAEDSAGTQFN